MQKIKASLLLIFTLVTFVVCSQEQSVADSLKLVYQSGDYEEFELYEILVSIAFNETQTEVANQFIDELIELGTERDSVRWLHSAYYLLGNKERLSGNYDLAFEAFYQSLDYAKNINYRAGEGIAYSAIGDLYSELGRSEDAQLFYNQGIDVLRELNDSTFLASVLLNAGDELVKQGKYDTALMYFYESGAIFTALDYAVGMAYTMGNMGMVYAMQGLHQLAESSIRQANATLESAGDYYGIASYNEYMVDIYVERGELERALEYAQSTYDIGIEQGLKPQIRDGALNLSRLLEQLGNPTESLNYLKIHNQYRDSINAESVMQKIADERRTFEVAQKQLEVDVLNQQKRNQQIIGVALGGVLLLAILLLVTLYRNNQRRKKLNLELSLLNETKDKFFGIISHDLRGPISAFYGISRIIKSYIRKQKYEELEKMTDDIDQSVSSIGSLLDNLLNWAVQQQGHFPYNPAAIDLHEMGENIISVLGPTAEAKSIKITTDIPSEMRLWADKNSLMTVLRNLTGNAIKFTPEGGTISISAEQQGMKATLKVTDSGVGMSSDKVGKLFETAEGESSYGTSGEKGIGLGLKLVHEFVNLNKGHISVESVVNQGTTFTIVLPIYNP